MKLFRSPEAQRRLATALAAYLRFVARTTRWRVEGEANLAALAGGPPAIVAAWHETLPVFARVLHETRARGLVRPATGFASRHRDGQLIARILGSLGMGVVAGSTSRGGAAGLLALRRVLADGSHVVLTPDGPRGPRRRAAPGLAQLAALSGVAVYAAGVVTRPALTLSSWDRMRIPLPFGRGAVVLSAGIAVPREAWQTALGGIEAALDAATARAAVLAGLRG